MGGDSRGRYHVGTDDYQQAIKFVQERQTTNLGVRSSNLFGRARNPINTIITCVAESAPCRIRKSAWHLHGQRAMGFDSSMESKKRGERGLAIQEMISSAYA